MMWGDGMICGGMSGPPMVPPNSAGEPAGIGRRPYRHIAGFSIRKEDGTEDPLNSRRASARPETRWNSNWPVPSPRNRGGFYGYGLDPFCNLTDGMDMAVPVFGSDLAG